MEILGKLILYAVVLNILWRMFVLFRDKKREKTFEKKKMYLRSLNKGDDVITTSGQSLNFLSVYRPVTQTISFNGVVRDVTEDEIFAIEAYYKKGDRRVLIKIEDIKI